MMLCNFKRVNVLYMSRSHVILISNETDIPPQTQKQGQDKKMSEVRTYIFSDLQDSL